MVQLKGRRAVGGMRASIYDAMPIEGVKRLVEYMREFEAKRGESGSCWERLDGCTDACSVVLYKYI